MKKHTHLHDLSNGMTVEEYREYKRQEICEAKQKSFERAQKAKGIREKKFQNLENWSDLSAKELADLARIEYFDDLSMGLDMKLWCQEMFQRIRNGVFVPINDNLNVHDVEVMLHQMMRHNFKEFRLLFENGSVQIALYTKKIKNSVNEFNEF